MKQKNVRLYWSVGWNFYKIFSIFFNDLHWKNWHHNNTTKNGMWLLEIGTHKQTHKSMVLHRERKFHNETEPKNSIK